jgi:broad specificity phosphatase PhoE
VTTTFLLVRHAAHDHVGSFLAGRTKGIRLGVSGREQAWHLGQCLACEKIDTVFTSPRERARETAAAITSARAAEDAMPADALDEVDFGGWSGRTFEDLHQDPAFKRWNAMRSLCRTPAGESMRDVQERILSFMEHLAAKGGQTFALISHADVIKAAVCYHLGLPLDAWPRFEISPASVSTLVLEEWGSKLMVLNRVFPDGWPARG